MDKGSVIGILLIVIAIFAGIFSGGEPILSYVNFASISIVVIGTIGAVMMSYRPKDFFAALGNTINAFRSNVHDIEQTINICIRLADKSRKQGVLALEEESYEDEFVQKAMEMLMTGKHFSARELAELGLINEVVAPGQAMAIACSN